MMGKVSFSGFVDPIPAHAAEIRRSSTQGKGIARGPSCTPWSACATPWSSWICRLPCRLALVLCVVHVPAESCRFAGRRKRKLRLCATANAATTYETFFDVHSRFARTSCASCTPSWKRARDFARRACAFACSSKSSRCLLLSWPELRFPLVLVIVNCAENATAIQMM